VEMTQKDKLYLYSDLVDLKLNHCVRAEHFIKHFPDGLQFNAEGLAKWINSWQPVKDTSAHYDALMGIYHFVREANDWNVFTQDRQDLHTYCFMTGERESVEQNVTHILTILGITE
jgi:hypothetical protein